MWYLINAETDANIVKLRFYDASEEEIIEVRDSKYKPYFLIPYPLSEKDKYTVDRILGKVSKIEKRDLFTGKMKTIAKVEIKNPDHIQKFSKMFEIIWENEIEFNRGYIYDCGLVFGSQYVLQGNRLASVSNVPEKEKNRFDRVFAEVKKADRLKYVQLKEFFDLCYHPIPQINPEILGIHEKIDRERYYLTFMLARIANLPVPEAYSNRRVSEWIKSMMYTYLRRNNFLIPTSKELRKGEKLKESVPGALTITPKSGIYFNTVVTDFESLYPSCIDSYNLSYETVDCKHKECRDRRISELDHHVCTRRRGFYSVIIGALKDLRIHWFKPLSKNPSISTHERLLAEALAKLLKLMSVSSYGVTVRIHGLASTPLAESITGYGRYALQTTWNMAEKRGLHPTYGDTDSIFLDDPSQEEVKWLVKTVKEKLRLDLAVEKEYSLCVLSEAKKAYFGILKNGTPDIKGLTVIKSNSPEFFLRVFRNCVKELSHVKNLGDYELAKKKIVAIVQKAIKDLGQRRIELKDLEYSVQLYFDPKQKVRLEEALHQPYQCAVQLIDAGVEVSKRDTVSFVKVNPFNYRGKKFTVKPTAHVKSSSEVNVNDYVRNLRTALGQTFKPMNIEFEIEKDKKISDWFGTNR
jgi:DNA polymerase elongation subunit (family B)